jgi:hypothetical protein
VGKAAAGSVTKLAVVIGFTIMAGWKWAIGAGILA